MENGTVDGSDLKQARFARGLQAIEFARALLFDELEADELPAAVRDRCLASIEDEGVALALTEAVFDLDFEVVGELAELAELLQLAVYLYFPLFENVLHQAVLFEHRHSSSF